MEKNEIIQKPEASGGHIVLLWAGASLAAIGEKSPTMNELIETLGLKPLLESYNITSSGNFKKVYSELSSDQKYRNLLLQIEDKIHNYFFNLHLPNKATHYRLLLSSRKKDAVFTFNWNPLLFDAYIRNNNVADLAGIFSSNG